MSHKTVQDFTDFPTLGVILPPGGVNLPPGGGKITPPVGKFFFLLKKNPDGGKFRPVIFFEIFWLFSSF